jgi:hypothetical protein
MLSLMAPDPWSLAISIFAAVIALGALGWNVASYVRSGGRIRISLELTFDATNGATQRVRPKRWPKTQSELGVATWSRLSLVVIVRSVGRGDVTVQRIAIGTSTKNSHANSSGIQVQLPHTMRAGGPALEYTRALADEEWLQHEGDGRVRGVVDLGDGRRVRGRLHRLPS